MAADRYPPAVVMVHDYPPYTGGGLALGVHELAGSLLANHDVCVLSSRWRDHFADDRGRRRAAEWDPALTVSHASVWRAVGYFVHADIIFTHWTFSVRRLATAGLVLGPLLGKPTVCVVHTAPAHCRFNRMRHLPTWARQALLAVVPRAMRRCTAVVALNEDHATALRQEGFPVTHVIPLMVSRPEIATSGRPRPNGHRRIVGVAGELSVLKGADRLPALVRELAPDFAFRIAGTGPLEKWLRVELPADVEMLGWIPPERMSDFYGSIDFLLVASRSEAQSRVTLEAMLAGVIVVAADDCGLTWIVEDAATGLVVDVEDPGSVHERLAALAENADFRAALVRRACASASSTLAESQTRWQRLPPLARTRPMSAPGGRDGINDAFRRSFRPL